MQDRKMKDQISGPEMQDLPGMQRPFVASVWLNGQLPLQKE